MPFWYYFNVPEIPQDASDGSNLVEIRRYVVSEGGVVDVGVPVAIVENHWAVMTLKANGKGIVRKIIFEPGTSVKVGDAIAVIGADAEDIPYGKKYALLEIVERTQVKPSPRTNPPKL